jgi:hypothetical protein
MTAQKEMRINNDIYIWRLSIYDKMYDKCIIIIQYCL